MGMADKKCKCLTPERRGFIDAVWDHSTDMPDGAFFAFMQEQGIDVGELEIYSDQHIASCTNF